MLFGKEVLRTICLFEIPKRGELQRVLAYVCAWEFYWSWVPCLEFCVGHKIQKRQLHFLPIYSLEHDSTLPDRWWQNELLHSSNWLLLWCQTRSSFSLEQVMSSRSQSNVAMRQHHWEQIKLLYWCCHIAKDRFLVWKKMAPKQQAICWGVMEKLWTTWI